MQKKVLIIQLDSSYFLNETLAVIEKYQSTFNDYELSVLTLEKSLNPLIEDGLVKNPAITTSGSEILKIDFDISFNLSLDESSWDFHSKVKSKIKIGPYLQDGLLRVEDHWSNYFITIKGGTPFLTFHLQDIYRNILGLKSRVKSEFRHDIFKTIAFDKFNPSFLSGNEYEQIINKLNNAFPLMELRDISEIDPISDLTKVLYVGPATLKSARLCSGGALGVFFTRDFQGLNLLPYEDGHIYVSTRGELLKAQDMFNIIEHTIQRSNQKFKSNLSVYKLTHEHLFGSYLQSENFSDDNYPVYQSHVVLWNFLLNLFEVNLDTIECTKSQIAFLNDHMVVLKKLIRLHNYALASIDSLYKETLADTTHADKIDAAVRRQAEVEEIFEKISSTFSCIRPLIDFYKIKKGQERGKNLSEESQNLLLTLSEEHQALLALNELFSVTLKKNEATI